LKVVGGFFSKLLTSIADKSRGVAFSFVLEEKQL